MSLHSQPSWNTELQRSEHYGSGGISATPGDQRDTGSGPTIIKTIPDANKNPLSTASAGSQQGWQFRIHCFYKIGRGGFGTVYLGKKYYERLSTEI